MKQPSPKQMKRTSNKRWKNNDCHTWLKPSTWRLLIWKKIEELQKNKRQVRPSTKVPWNKAEARLRPDFEEWAKAHDSELERQKRSYVPGYTGSYFRRTNQFHTRLTYKEKTNQFGGIEMHKKRCAIKGDVMKPGKHSTTPELRHICHRRLPDDFY